MTAPYRTPAMLNGDDMPGDSVPNVPVMLEVGRTGLRRAGGYLDEEFLPALRGRKAVQVFREMSDNDAIIGALLFALMRLISEVTWRVEPSSSKAEDRQNAEFLEQAKDDMRQSWSELIMEVMSMLPYGWSWHEICYKKRLGPWYTGQDGQNLHRSKYDDGKITWAAMPIRAQESLQRWVFYPNGEVKAMIQMPAPTYDTRIIPMSKSLLFRPQAPKGNPEGRSLLRNAYRSWFMKKRLEEYEAIGVERDLAGLPVATIPAKILNARQGTDEYKMLLAYRKMVKSVRRDEQEGLVLPSEFDDGGNPMYDFKLLTSGGSRQFDTNTIISRYEQRMLMQCLADFILVGHEGVGSYNMHTDKTGLFKVACNSFVQAIADVLNRDAVPKLFSLNGVKPKELPKLVPNDVDSPDLAQLGAFMTAMAGAGVQWFPDPKLEAFLRSISGLPEMDKEQEKALEVQQRQARIIAMATQKLQGLQIGQQAAQGEAQTAQAQQSAQQGAIQTASSAAEFAKPGVTQPPQKAGPPGAGRPPTKSTGKAGPPKKAAGKSNAPAKRKAGKK
jgi:hypothetical protein